MKRHGIFLYCDYDGYVNFLKNIFTRKKNIVVIAGPTASGKTSLSIELAQRFNAEVISADSRQVYRGLDIGSAKVTEEEMDGITHHLLDVADPSEVFTVAQYRDLAETAIETILKQKKLPIICGGSGFYIDALVYGTDFPEVAPNEALRAELEALSEAELFTRIEHADPKRAATIDRHNKVRLVRALEIINALGSVPSSSKKASSYNVLYLGLELPREQHHEIIDQRIHERLEQGMLNEVRQLHNDGLSWERLEDLGLEYRYLAQHLQGTISLEQAIELISRESKKFIKRQYTWFKKNEDVQWFNPLTQKDEIISAVEKFLN